MKNTIGLFHRQHAKNSHRQDPEKNRGGDHVEAGCAKSETLEMQIQYKDFFFQEELYFWYV